MIVFQHTTVRFLFVNYFSVRLSPSSSILPLHGYSSSSSPLHPSPPDPSVRGHMLPCRWVPVSSPAAIGYCLLDDAWAHPIKWERRQVGGALRELTASGWKTSDYELMTVDSREQSIVGRASPLEGGEVAKVGEQGRGKKSKYNQSEWKQLVN